MGTNLGISTVGEDRIGAKIKTPKIPGLPEKNQITPSPLPDMQCNTIQLNFCLYFIPCEVRAGSQRGGENIWRAKREKRVESAGEASTRLNLSSPDYSRLAPFVLDHIRLARTKPNRVPVRRLSQNEAAGTLLEKPR